MVPSPDRTEEPTQLDQIMIMLTKMRTDLNEVKVRVIWLEDKKSPGGSPRSKVSSSLIVDVVSTETNETTTPDRGEQVFDKGLLTGFS